MRRTAHRAVRALAALGLASLLALAGCATAPVGGPDRPADAAVAVAAPAPAPVPPVPVTPPAPIEAANAAVADAEANPPPAPPQPVDPLQPEVKVDLDSSAAQADLWERVRRGFAMPDLTGSLVENRERWYAARPDYVQRMTERGGRYLFHIVEEVERRGLPTELALLPFIESAFNPKALSSAKASGIWQFIPSTGRDFDLTQNIFRDERRDVLASTRAALDYLQKLYGMFGDWHLALAAYNWGEGSVQRALARNRKAGQPTDYESLRMPQETRYYVPKLQAVKNIIARPADYSIELPPLANHPYFLSVPIDRDIDVALAARLAGMSVEEFNALNPQMNSPLLLGAGTARVLLPYDNATLFIRGLAKHPGPFASWTAWTAPRTMHPSDVAAQVGMEEAHLRKINNIPPRMLVKAGSTLLVPRGRSRASDISAHLAENGAIALAPEPRLRRVAIKAGKHDTVASIAQRYGVSASRVAQWNHTAVGAKFKPGQRIVVHTSAPATRTASSRKAVRSAAKKPVRTVVARKPAAGSNAKQSSRSAKASVRTTTAKTRRSGSTPVAARAVGRSGE